MAAFMGGVEGQRGPATRLGSKNSGINAWAKSWDSKISTEYEVRDDATYVRVFATDLHSGKRVELWSGLEAALVKKARRSGR